MEPKKSHKANLERRRAVNFFVGLLVSLSLILISFEWTTLANKFSEVDRATDIPFINEMMEITRREEPPPLPEPKLPAIAEVIQLVDNDIELDEIDFNVEVTRDTWVDYINYYDTEPEKIEGEEERFIVEIMPTFKGGDPRVEFKRYIASKMVYPPEAAQNGVKGRVYVKFVVNNKGELTQAEIYKGIHPELDNEALRVIKSSPLWEPGIQSGMKVSVTYIFPINFVLY